MGVDPRLPRNPQAMKTFILALMLTLTNVSAVVAAAQPAEAGAGSGINPDRKGR